MSVDNPVTNNSSCQPVLLLPPSTSATSQPSDDMENDDSSDVVCSSDKEAIVPGRISRPYGSGLGNLGNTCFMNSTLQCLAHTDPLRRYFLSGDYRRDLNRDNPLGTGGDLAERFAELLAEMWGTTTSTTNGYGSYSSSYNSLVVYPRRFKQTLGRHAEQFIGYDQHDSQELATYLLDALHEDTNRITRKPYVEKPEQGENESDEHAANKAWALHLKREDSRVQEFFMGQVKSRVQCCKPNCGRISTTFEPSLFLSVPIPGSSEKTINITFVPLDTSRRAQSIHVRVSKTALIRDAIQKLIQQLRAYRLIGDDELLGEEDFCLADVFEKYIYGWLEPEDSVDRIGPNDKIFAYQLTPLAQSKMTENDRVGGEAIEKCLIEKFDLRERQTPRRYQLPTAVLSELNTGEEWSKRLEHYLYYPIGYAVAFNRKRSTIGERVKFYNKLCTFIDTCYQDVDNDMVGQKRSREETSSGSLRIMVDPNEDPLPCLRGRCDSNQQFKNVERRLDVAIIEFAAGKLRLGIIQEKEAEQNRYPNGVVIQMRTRRLSQDFAEPFLLRIPPNTTVYGLRQQLAKYLSRAIKKSYSSKPSPASGESTSERHVDVVERDSRSFGDPDLMTLRQIPLTYQTYGDTKTKGRLSFGDKLGALAIDGGGNDGGRPVQLASPSDPDETVLVAHTVGERASIFMHWTDDLCAQYFDEEEFHRVECPAITAMDDGPVSGTRTAKNNFTVLDCIEKHCQQEQLEASEMWYCNRCKEHVRAWKQFSLYRSPPILIIHLKRFQYSATTHRRDKIDDFIEFPLKGLDLTGQVMSYEDDQRPIYDCYAVSNHYGGLGGGQYVEQTLCECVCICYGHCLSYLTRACFFFFCSFPYE